MRDDGAPGRSISALLRARVSRRDALKAAAVGGVTLLGAAACQLGPGGPGAAGSSPTTIRVGTLKLQHLLQPYFYQQFGGDRYRIEVNTFVVGAEGRDALVNRSIDFLITGHTFGMQSVIQGQPLTVLAAAVDGGAGFVVRADSPYRSLRDLEGKKVGVARGTPQDVMLRSLLQREGLADRVNIVQVPLPDQRNALGNREVDAYVGAEPSIAMDLVEGTGRLVVPSEQLYSTGVHALNGILLGNVDFIREHESVTRDLVRMHSQATDYMNGNHTAWFDKTREITASSEAVAAKAAENIQLYWKIDDAYVQKAKDFAATLKTFGYLQGDVDFNKYFTLKYQPQ